MVGSEEHFPNKTHFEIQWYHGSSDESLSVNKVSKLVRDGIWTHAHNSGSDLESDPLDHSATLTWRC